MADFSQFTPRIGTEPNPYEAALQKALDDRDGERLRVDEARERLTEHEAHVAELSSLIDALFGLLPAESRAQYLERINSKAPLGANAVISDKVIQLFVERKQTLSAPEITEALKDKGIEENLKSVQNSLSYLEAKKHLVRVSRGRYRLGSAAETAAAIEEMLTQAYGPPTFRGHPPSDWPPPHDY
jgi:hypothetical protein